MKPRLLDLFCGAGGASMGYYRAGFEVVGVDVLKQPRYPFTFVQIDAMDVLLNPLAIAATYDTVHASPPCQHYSRATLPESRKGYPDLVDEVRLKLELTGLPWIIENVVDSPVRGNVMICGCHVGLPEIRRLRKFELSWNELILMPSHQHEMDCISVVGHGTPSWYRRKHGKNASVADKKRVMGIDWMNRYELAQAIPPNYTEFLGKRLIARMETREESA